MSDIDGHLRLGGPEPWVCHGVAAEADGVPRVRPGRTVAGHRPGRRLESTVGGIGTMRDRLR
ncbi:hypothetical protein RB614_36115 [Phytohabitans sp. ZYX-F-186]|uniref:Uncharacterized protein n=1 Tax=Phytohabitans maris TaxID=3071409 RepID=A0ABU0ZSK2_9ACTN|nr:hypothetical protein [Phytohabitans sp. ZYX-F-186]MDQ7909938.1 hypothetical protein [Phytohabitans sp. ZYX-F-186]